MDNVYNAIKPEAIAESGGFENFKLALQAAVAQFPNIVQSFRTIRGDRSLLQIAEFHLNNWQKVVDDLRLALEATSRDHAQNSFLRNNPR